jgi:hypothetical protein
MLVFQRVLPVDHCSGLWRTARNELRSTRYQISSEKQVDLNLGELDARTYDFDSD